jgi:hypothetical protein
MIFTVYCFLDSLVIQLVQNDKLYSFNATPLKELPLLGDSGSLLLPLRIAGKRSSANSSILCKFDYEIIEPIGGRGGLYHFGIFLP